MCTFVSMPQCFRHVGTCVQLVSPYLLSSVCFKWRKCISSEMAHLPLRSGQATKHKHRGFFWIPRSVDCSDFEHNARNLILKGTLHEDDQRQLFIPVSERLSMAISSLPLNLKSGTGRRSGCTKFKLYYMCGL